VERGRSVLIEFCLVLSYSTPKDVFWGRGGGERYKVEVEVVTESQRERKDIALCRLARIYLARKVIFII